MATKNHHVMKASERKKWTTALRSGKYHQGNGQLYDNYTKTYCCLGVAKCAIGNKQPKQLTAMLRPGTYGLSKNLQRALALSNDRCERHYVVQAFHEAGYNTQPNDGYTASFKDIADWIDENL